jgi:hypothetical protein
VALGDQGIDYLPGISGLANLLAVPVFAASFNDFKTVLAVDLELSAPKLFV